MTCIIGYVHDGKVYMGCDSASASGWETRRLGKTKKIIYLPYMGKMLLGVAGWPRVSQILCHHLKDFLDDTVFADYVTNKAWFVGEHIVEPIRSCLRRYNLLETENDIERMKDTEILLGFAGELFSIGPSFCIEQYVEPFTAIGVGSQYAMGAMEAFMLREDFEPEFIVRQALRISGQFCNGVCDPYHVEVL